MENRTQTFNVARLMVKVDRCAAWTLFVVILLYIITGYGMTKQIIRPDIASSLHLDWLGIAGLIAFTLHTSWAIHLSFRRWKFWNALSKTCLALFYILLIFSLCYVHFFYSPESTIKNLPSQPSSNSDIKTSNDKSPIIGTTDNTQSEAIFTPETLSTYNGKNGQPSYIAVDGLVYDVSSLFRNGEHNGCQAGKDVSDKFQEQHSSSILQRFEVIGKYQAN